MNLKTAKELNEMTYCTKHKSYRSHLFKLAKTTHEAGMNGQFNVNHYIGELPASDKILLVEHLKVEYGFEVIPLYSKSVLDAEMINISWERI